MAITVEDGGLGVPDAELDSIFERFARIDERPARDRRGFGLGLAVVRGLIEAMGGAAPSDAERARRARRDSDGSRRPGNLAAMSPDAPLLLLVEDDETTRRAVARHLAGHGYRVEEQADGEGALAAWERARPDLILLDLGLPGIDGLTVVQRVRRDATTPIIVISARDQELDKVAALDAGADDFLTKPFGMHELRARVRAALRRALSPAALPDGRVRVGPLELDPARRRGPRGRTSRSTSRHASTRC